MGDIADFAVGQTVELQDGRVATVQFVGTTHFAPGDWVGIELQDASGKNNGAVQGQRYFDCAPGHGMFVRPAVAVVLEDAPEPAPPPPKALLPKAAPPPAANGAAKKPRPSSTAMGPKGLRRQSVLDPAAKRRSINEVSPTPGPKAPAPGRSLRSPTKSPTKGLSQPTSTNAAPTTSSAPSRPSTLASRSRMSITGRPPERAAPAATTRTSRPSLAGPSNGLSRPSVQPTSRTTNRLSTLKQPSKPSSVGGASRESDPSEKGQPSETADGEGLSPGNSEPSTKQNQTFSPPQPSTSVLSRAALSPPSTTAQDRIAAMASQRSAPASSAAAKREVEDLKTKLRLLEKKRLEDRDKLKALEQVQAERDRFEGIIHKLQAKYQPQQQEIAELRRQVKDAEARASTNETQQADADVAVEMAALDREMAEEQAEAYCSELEALRQKYEELALEVEVLREENAELGQEMSPEERTSQGWLQLERSNERLREALLRLRDMTHDQEADLKGQIQELEKDVQELGGFRDRFTETNDKLGKSEAVADDLRQQLEAALGAEEMIEELTDNNMRLTEKIDEMRAAIDDLESLKELNDELDINHQENEKQLQDEIDYREAACAELIRKCASQDETIEDLEYTVSRFRGLVGDLRGDLEDMQAAQQITENQASELNHRSRAMQDLNLRLQASASKTQVKAIDVELQRLEAQESAEQLAIVKLFLPDSYASDRDSIHAFLRLKRIGFKAHLLHGFVRERVNGVAVPGHEDDIFVACDILDQLTWVGALCVRFVKFVETCSLEAFKKLEAALFDLEPVERAFNAWIDALKRGDLQEKQCATELRRSVALLTHLAEAHIPEDSLADHTERVVAQAQGLQAQCESAAAAIAQIKAIAQARLPLPPDADEAEATAQAFLQRADGLTSQIRSAKVVAAKAARQLEELRERSLTLNPDTAAPTVDRTVDRVAELAAACRTAGTALALAVNEEGRAEALTHADIAAAMSPQSPDAPAFSALAILASSTASDLQSLHALTTTLSHTVELPSVDARPPWQLLAQRLRDAQNAAVSRDTELSRLRDALAEARTHLALKDRQLEELHVAREVLERRIDHSGSRRARLRELEDAVAALQSEKDAAGREAAEALETLQAAQRERDAWKAQAAAAANGMDGAPRAVAADAPADSDVGLSGRAAHDFAALKAEISALRAAVRHLGAEKQSAQLAAARAFLTTPLAPTRPSRTEWSALAPEAGDVLKAMRELVARPESRVVQLKPRSRAERAAWRPAKDEIRWQVGRQREEWETWREWRDDVSARTRELAREGMRRPPRPKQATLLGAGKDGEVKVQVVPQEDGKRRLVDP